MADDVLALILDESKWLTIGMGASFLTVSLLLYRHRRTNLAAEARTLAALTVMFAGTISVMAFGHLLAVTVKLLTSTVRGSAPVVYAIGVVLAVPSWWLLVHAVRRFDQIRSRRTLVLNGALAITLVALGPANLPLAIPGLLNVLHQFNSRPRVGWAIAGATLMLTAALFVGSLMFWASGQTFEQFRGMQ
ncbi:MAG: hypothetical protein ACT4QD_22635 [Acidobacteriota bacterium]